MPCRDPSGNIAWTFVNLHATPSSRRGHGDNVASMAWRYAFTHLEGNVVRFAPLYQQYNGGAAMKTHWMKNRNATIFEPPHRKRRGRVSQNYRDELQRRRAKKACGAPEI